MPEKKLLAGYGRVAVTPDFPVHIAGYGDDEVRMSKGVLDDLYITCIAVTDGDDTVLMYTVDMLSLAEWAANKIRQVVSPVTGIPGEYIFCGATHSHSSPLLYGQQEPTVRFRENFMNKAIEAAQIALADRAPAEMLTATKALKNMNFIRHYEMEDGTYSGSAFGDHSLKIVRHATETDPRLVLIKFAREEKPSIVMMNWQAHNDNAKAAGYYNLTSSYVGRVRAKFEKDTDMHFAFFMGASGNQNCNSRIPEEHHGLEWVEYGERMAEYAMETMADLKPVTGSGIKVKRVIYVADVDHSWDHMLEQAKEVFNTWKTVGKREGDIQARSYGFTSTYQARDIIGRSSMPLTTELELNAFRIGDMGFVTSCNEVFSTVGFHVRANSPFETTFIITGNNRYLPCKEAYDYRSYEADTALYARGTAEQVADKLVEMLNEVR